MDDLALCQRLWAAMVEVDDLALRAAILEVDDLAVWASAAAAAAPAEVSVWQAARATDELATALLQDLLATDELATVELATAVLATDELATATAVATDDLATLATAATPNELATAAAANPDIPMAAAHVVAPMLLLRWLPLRQLWLLAMHLLMKRLMMGPAVATVAAVDALSHASSQEHCSKAAQTLEAGQTRDYQSGAEDQPMHCVALGYNPHRPFPC